MKPVPVQYTDFQIAIFMKPTVQDEILQFVEVHLYT